MAQKTDSTLTTDNSGYFASGSNKWTGIEVQTAIQDLIDSKINKDKFDGGGTGQVLKKLSNTDFDFGWGTDDGGGVSSIPANVYFLSKNGCTSDADLSLGSSTFGTDNTTAIQAVLDNGGTTPILVIVDGKYSATHLRVKSNTTIICLEGCGFIQRDNSDRTFLTNYNPTNSSYADKNITIIGGIWNYNGKRGGTYRQIKTNTTYGWVVGMRFAGVENVKLFNNIHYNSRNFLIFVTYFKNVIVENQIWEGVSDGDSNTDGIKFLVGQGAVLKNVFAKYLLDDVFSFCSNDVFFTTYPPPTPIGGGQTAFDPYVTYGTITDCLADGIYADQCNNFGRVFTSGHVIKNCTIRNLQATTGNSGAGGLIIDNYAEGPQNMNTAGDGMIYNLTIENIVAKGNYHGCVVWISCNVKNLYLRNVRRYSHASSENQPTILFDGTGNTGAPEKYCLNAIIEGQEVMMTNDNGQDTATNAYVEVANDFILHRCILQNMTYDRSQMATIRNAPIFRISGGTCTNLILNQIYGDNIQHIVEQTGGTLSYIAATNIVHKNASGNATFQLSGMVTDAFMSGYYGFTRTGGAGSITTTRGDGFTGSLPIA